LRDGAAGRHRATADPASDAALVAGLAVTDELASEAFVWRFQSRVFGLALSITRDVGLAQDVSQEVFVRAWRAAGTYDLRRSSVLTWLLAITRNAAIDSVRARRPTPTEGAVLEEMITARVQAPSPEEEALRRSERAAVVATLLTLPREQARAVVLAVVDGRTAAEVSEHEGIPLGTAKTRIRTGLRRARAAMAAGAGDEPG
jgi:RNA polymerase sigma-70 factor (ECF subfamily)